MQKKLLRNKKILITGGAGFIGSFLCERLVKNNTLTVFDTLRRNALQYSPVLNHKNLHLITGDVLDQSTLSQVVKDKDVVIHLAAIAGVSSYYKNPLQTLEVDAWGTYGVLNAANEHKVNHVILFSTSEVYGPHAQDVTEKSLTVQGPATDSRWSYAVGKLIGDHFAFAFSKMKKLNITIVRPFNIYGPRQVGEGAIQIFITQALQNTPLVIRGDGTQKRAWCYIDDFIDGVCQMINNKQAYNQIFNLGNPEAFISVTDLAKLIIRLSKSTSQIEHTPHAFTDIINRSPSIKKAQQIIGYDPHVSMQRGLEQTIDWFATDYDAG